MHRCSSEAESRLGTVASSVSMLCISDFLGFPLSICYFCNQKNLNAELAFLTQTLLREKSKL